MLSAKKMNGNMRWIAAWVLSLPAMAMAQQIAVSGGYPVPTAGSQPQGITAGPDGALWFTEFNGFKIGRITTAGTTTEFEVGTGLAGITAGPDGALWFTEIYAHKIGRITTAGIITEYLVPTALSDPDGITAGPDGALWFTEYAGNKIGRITTAGIITEYALATVNSDPFGITAGPDGALWFTESGFNANQIGRITTAGAITEYPLPNAESVPEAITVGPDGALWFAEGGPTSWRIGRITTTGVITEYPVPTANSSPNGITAGPDGALWFTEFGGNKIGRINTAGVITEYPVPKARSGPFWITAGPDGELWFTEEDGNRIGQVFFLAATLSASPASGASGASLSFTGSGFAPNESVQIYLSGVGSAVLTSGTADSTGSFTAAARVPQSPHGPRLFLGLGQTSGKLGAASFSIAPRLILQPTSGPVGSTVTAQGTGFGSLEQVTITWLNPKTVLGTATANVNGTFGGAAAITFTVPTGAASGVNKVEALGKTTKATAYTSFTVQ